MLLNLPLTGRDLSGNWALMFVVDTCILFGTKKLQVWVELTAKEEGLSLKDCAYFKSNMWTAQLQDQKPRPVSSSLG